MLSAFVRWRQTTRVFLITVPGLFEPHVPLNFLYRQPRTGIEVLMRSVCAVNGRAKFTLMSDTTWPASWASR
jgi:hypothetical protein